LSRTVTGITQNHRLHNRVRVKQYAHTPPGALAQLITAVVLLLSLSAAAAANELSAIRHWSSPTSTRIVLDCKQGASYKTPQQTAPEKLVLDITDVTGPVPVSALPIDDGIVKTVTAVRTDSSTIRITIELTKPASHKIFPLEKYMDKPPRLAIDIVRPDLEQADKVQRQQTRKLKEKQVRIVVIDAGHGGEDPGAIGPGKTLEKDVVLAIARKTVQLLNREPGVKAYLTRKSDYFIPLGTRMTMAQEHGADLFISIHADYSFSSKVQGSSIYCLSLKGASSAAAEKLARQENESDSVGGVPLEHHNDDLNAILIDLVQTKTLNASLKCAGITIQELARFNRMRTDQPQQAGFKVLKNPDITSMLIETDFLSNPRREQKLKSEQFQNSLATAITAAANKFFAATQPPVVSEPPARGAVAPKAPVKKVPARPHTVARGGAQQPADSELRAGAAAAPKASRKKPPALVHTVIKGDSLSSIAHKYGITVTRLKALNSLSEKSTIRAGMKLKVAQAE
jgi:N-acetylmuramoyl-L-alanine amidase